jgi:hypothetical protein
MKVLTSAIALMSTLLFGTGASAVDVFPVKYEKVTFSWKSETMFEGIIKVYLQNNTGEAIQDVVATISSTPANTKVIDGTVTFAHIPAGEAVLSQDSFSVQTDTGNPADPNEGVTWEISYKDSNGNVHVLQSVSQFPAGE